MSDLAKMVAIAKKFGGSGGGSVQTDWNQNDENAADFLKNRPFGDEKTVFFEEQEIVFEAGEASITVEMLPTVGTDVVVRWDGVEYVCHASDYNGAVFIGNGSPLGGEDTDEPFAFMFVNEQMVFAICLEEKTSATVKISGQYVQKIDEKYISTTKMFYLSDSDSDVYLYADIGCSTKVTAGELKTALMNQTAMFTQNEIYYFGLKNVAISASYGMVSLFGMDFENPTMVRYTAEYTPE